MSNGCKICPRTGRRVCGDDDAECLICGQCTDEAVPVIDPT